MNRCFGPAVVALVLVGSLMVAAADWPQWRGPNRDGVSKETGLLQKWPEGGPKLVWQSTDLGEGYGSPSIAGERLYVTGSQGLADEFVQCLNVSDGKQVWKTRIGAVGENRSANYPGSRSSPTIDGERVYVLGSDGDLVCLAANDGNIVWQKHLERDFHGKRGVWAYAESPLVDGDVLVCTPGGGEATIVALKKSNGELIWKYVSSDPKDEAGYSSAIVVETDGVKQYVQLLNGALVGLDAKTGQPLWRYTGIINDHPNIPTPVSRNDVVYGSTAKGGGGFVRLKRSGKGIEAAEIFASSKLPKAIGGSVEVNGYLYGTGTGGLMCVEVPSGDVKWQDRSVGVGSIVYADGRLYLRAENPPGEVALVEATPEGYKEHGRFTPANGPERRTVDTKGRGKKVGSGKTWAYPSIADGKLYVRDWNCLWCYDIRAK